MPTIYNLHICRNQRHLPIDVGKQIEAMSSFLAVSSQTTNPTRSDLKYSPCKAKIYPLSTVIK